ncbi:MAG: DinB family protein [Bacteroidetes bacterium]|nr:DinB family protein [Bacteroidota bacterium]
MKPNKETYPPYYENYILLIKNDNLTATFTDNEKEVFYFFTSLSSDLENYAYEPGKWTIKEVLNHIIDTERIFAYRALRFARKDSQQNLSFDQDQYVLNAELVHRSLNELVEEFITVRQATISLYKSFSSEALQRIGSTVAGNAGVNAIGFTICGHASHHINVIKERYLKK